MSDESPLGPDLLAALNAQAAWKADQDRIEASLTPLEKKLRAKFEAAINGPETVELSEFNVNDPTTLLVFAEAYRQEGICLAYGKKLNESRAIREPYETATFTCVAIWMAVRGHEEFIELFRVRRRMPMIPLLPKDWHYYKDKVYSGMGLEVPVEGPKVVPLRQGLQAI